MRLIKWNGTEILKTSGCLNLCGSHAGMASKVPLFAFQKGGGDDSSGQRYSADPTGLLSERGAKGDQDGYMAAMRDKKISGDFVTM